MSGRSLPQPQPLAQSLVQADHGDACITCGDVALPLTVVSVDGNDARCRDDATGAEELVAVDLVAPVAAGDRLLVHARVAIEVVEEAP